jgi:large subunit ribosomal protein L30
MAEKKKMKLRITQVRSGIGRKDVQKRTLVALGLRRMHHTVIQPDRPEIRGMINRISHLVKVEEVNA